MSSEEWYRQKLEELKNSETRQSALNEIWNNLYNESPETTIASNLLQSSEIFQCLEEAAGCNNQQESDFILDILSICMSTVGIVDRADYIHILKKCLSHPNPKVQSLALQRISAYLSKHPELTSFDHGITMTVIKCLDQSETSIGALAIEILSRILISTINNANIKEEFLKRSDSSKSGSEVIRCRVYEICVNLAKKSPSILNEVEIFLNRLISELENNDVLLQLNILELFVSLAEQNHGLIFLESKQIFEKISKRVEQIPENPLDTVLIPGFMKFFGKIAYSQPQKIIIGYPNMIQCLFDCLLSEEVSILPTAFDTLGNLAHSSQGKLLLDEKYSLQMVVCFQKFAVYLQKLPSELKIREFNALEIIFKTEGVISQDISNITKKWYQHMAGATNFRLLLDFAKNPFPDIKTACLSFVKVLCEYEWGVIALRDTSIFIEYLLDRRVEFNQNALLIKYEIIKMLSETTVFDVHTLLQLKKYVEEGAHYVEGIVEVAIEGC